MDTSLHIRDARDDERAAVHELTTGAYGVYAEVMTPEGWAGLRQAVLGGLAVAHQAERIVAERGGDLVGSVLLFPPAEGAGGAGGRMVWPELRLLAVAPEARGHGVGTALIRECAARARASGAPALGLYTSESMRAALRLYPRLGFARVPEHDFTPPGGELVQAFKLDLGE